MSLGDEMDKPTAEGSHLASGGPAPDKGPAEVTHEPSLIPVIVSSDGSAVIDGIPVPVVGGETVDVAILDTLHGYARSRNSPVRAAISDPSAGYVAIVQVEPDGSSRLVEQRQEESARAAQVGEDSELAEPVTFTKKAALTEPGAFPENSESAEVTGHSEPTENYDLPSISSEASTADNAAVGRLGRAKKHESASAGSGTIRRRLLSQSDDEYEPPAFLKRPLGVGIAGLVAAAVVCVPLVALGSSEGGEKRRNEAAGSSNVHAPSTTRKPPPSSFTPGASLSKPPSPSKSTVPKPSRSSKPAAAPPQASGGSEIVSGEVLVKNKKYGFCLDLPGASEGALNTQVQDGECKASSRDNQDWVLDRVSKSDGARRTDLYLIHNVSSGLCLDLAGYGPVGDTSSVRLFSCNASKKEDNQLWWLDKRPNGSYWIRNQKSGNKCLDVSRGNRKAAHTIVTLFGCSDRDDHEWNFIKG